MTKLWVEESALFPMFWIEEFAEIDETYQRFLSDKLTWPLEVIRAIQWTLVTLFHYKHFSILILKIVILGLLHFANHFNSKLIIVFYRRLSNYPGDYFTCASQTQILTIISPGKDVTIHDCHDDVDSGT